MRKLIIECKVARPSKYHYGILVYQTSLPFVMYSFKTFTSLKLAMAVVHNSICSNFKQLVAYSFNDPICLAGGISNKFAFTYT